jgi:hypothetical protein
MITTVVLVKLLAPQLTAPASNQVQMDGTPAPASVFAVEEAERTLGFVLVGLVAAGLSGGGDVVDSN